MYIGTEGAAGLGNEPRRLFDELGELRMMDVVLPTLSLSL